MSGLAAAGALARIGWTVTLLERADRLRPGRAAVLLWPNGVRALASLGLGGAGGVEAVGTPVPALGVRRQDGRWLQQPDESAPVALAVHRTDLHDMLVAGLGDQVQICTGVTVRTTRPTTRRPAVSDGKATWEADLVVGADGADSVLRRRLAPASTLVSGGYALWRAVIPWYRVPDVIGASAGGELIGDGHRFSYAGLGDRVEKRGGVYWVAAAPGAARPEPPETQLTLLRRWFAGWYPPVGDLLAATDPEDLVQETVRDLRPVPKLSHPAGLVSGQGRLTAGSAPPRPPAAAAVPGGYVLVGDAAHAMSAHAGQGPGLAAEDAATLQIVLHGVVEGGSLGEALADYARLRSARIARVGAHVRRLDAALHSRGRFSVGSRFAPRLLERVAAVAAEWVPPAR
jgi:2-polyprenyl-6-methoxyphenol hydroxylase-like FAD-dependent oxidoreductase